MQQPIFYSAGDAAALCHAKNRLIQWGYEFSPIPCDHVTHLLLPVPSFESPGILKGGQHLDHVLKHLPENIMILGGKLPVLPYRCGDFLEDAFYLTENAAITAQCARRILQQAQNLHGVSILLIGFGRIGKRLLPLLQEQGALVTIALRKEKELSLLRTYGQSVVMIGQWDLSQYGIIINTAPALLLDQGQASPDAMLLDLASTRGISGDRVLWARGLPNRMAPEESGTLIAKTALRYVLGKENL